MAKTSVQVYYDYTDQFELLDDAQFRKNNLCNDRI